MGAVLTPTDQCFWAQPADLGAENDIFAAEHAQNDELHPKRTEKSQKGLKKVREVRRRTMTGVPHPFPDLERLFQAVGETGQTGPPLASDARCFLWKPAGQVRTLGPAGGKRATTQRPTVSTTQGRGRHGPSPRPGGYRERAAPPRRRPS